ncbi:MAG: DEAD/DEAH box helicase family protein [Deltaproteobacteria bacterium]|nr:DEAD/DEAH box helicase family protein [Deltaproteobacteria bacterium]
MRTLRYNAGTLVLVDFPPEEVPDGFVWDERVGALRGHAARYHQVALDLHRRGVPYRDEAKAYALLDRRHRTDRSPRPYQGQAVRAWRDAGRRGTVVLPTGAGKSFVAELCIADAGRSAMVVAPTIDLVGQWYDQLVRAFGEPVGVLGGGVHQVEALTVSTYDSAWMHMERYGDRFGLLVFDEVHHLPGPSYSQAALMSLAPYRLGLTATLERSDGAHHEVDGLVGPVVFRREIQDMAGEFLADYRTEILEVYLSDEDQAAYEDAYAEYRAFVDLVGIRVGAPGGWQSFLRAAGRTRDGRRAYRAWRRSREIVQGAPAKLRLLEELLRRHRGSRVILFTADNATAFEISRRFLVPSITHQTDVKERRALLAAFTEGTLPVLATSRVLNEGVDLPAAEVAVVLSGSNTVREHVQRLGRILRPREGKSAVLYELVVANSSEMGTSERRREHAAYQR